MKNTFIILLSGLLICGCSKKQAPSVSSAIDLIQAGKDIVRPDGTIIHVTKRVGASIEGIQISKSSSPTTKLTITADTGTLEQGFDRNTVRLIIYHAKIESKSEAGTSEMFDEKMSIVL
jgi:hypothetical protein